MKKFILTIQFSEGMAYDTEAIKESQLREVIEAMAKTEFKIIGCKEAE